MEKEFIINVSADYVVFGIDSETIQLKVLLIRKSINHPHIQSDSWKLPSGLIKRNEDPDIASKRILKELTGLQNIKKCQLKAFGAIDKIMERSGTAKINSEHRLISIPYYSLIDSNQDKDNGLILNETIRWFPIKMIKHLSIHHHHSVIIEFALKTLRNKLQTSPFIFEFLPSKFTLGQLQKIYETVFGIEIDKRNFRKKISTLNYIVPLREKEVGVSHRPATLYRFRYEQYKRIYMEQTNMLPVSILSNI